MRFSPVVLLGLAAVAAAELNSWNDVVGDVSQCMKTCLNSFYTDSGFDSKCGSPDQATVDCLCGAKASFSNMQDSADQMGSCIQSGCDASDLTNASSQLSGVVDRLTNLENQCMQGKLVSRLLLFPKSCGIVVS